MKIEAILTPADIGRLPAMDLTGKTCVVFDVLRATSSMVTALYHGAQCVWPVTTVAEARALHVRTPDALLGGERQGDRIDGFDVGNSPPDYANFTGRKIISTTTNGTVALRACDGAGEILAAALLNLQATADYLVKQDCGDLVLVCAGTHALFALEDGFAAGALIDLLPSANLSDAAYILHQTFLGNSDQAQEVLRRAANGQALIGAGRESDLRWCAQVSVMDVVVKRAGDCLVADKHEC